MGMLKESETHKQSIAAWRTWRKKWLDNCAVNRHLPATPLAELVNAEQGNVIVQAAFGYSLALNLDVLRRYRDRVTVVCCDKAFGYLMDNGVRPDYCVLADASVATSWQGGHDTAQTTLVANVAANTDWTTGWKGRRAFYLNWDNIGTANVLSRASGKREVIPASSNVSNCQVVFSAQVLNPDAHLLVGYDYSWQDDGLYYASQDSIKRAYMHHNDIVSPFGGLVQTSSNLLFSCQWLTSFLHKFGQLTVVNCSGRGIMPIANRMPLEAAIKKYTKEG